MEHLAILRHDIGYACRALRRAPVFTISAVLTLAVGMGAIGGMFTILNAVMFRPLPVSDPERLISISHRTGTPYGLSFRDLEDYRAQSPVLDDAIGYAPRPAALNADGVTERIVIEVVTDNYFSVLGVQPAAGRLIQPGEGRAPGDAPVVVLAHDYWQARFHGDTSVLGRSVRIGGRPFTVIGVVSATFNDTESLVRVAAYVPAWMLDALPGPDATGRPASSVLEDRGARVFTVLGRLKRGVTIAEARAALDVRAAALARDFPSTHTDVALRVVPEPQTRPTPELGPFLRVAGSALAGLAAVLLLITSANVANLFFARSLNRRPEVALRSALGARRGRIVRQFLTESLVLALTAAAVAIPIVVVAMGSLNHLFASVSAVVAIAPDFSIDVRVIIVTLFVALLAGVLSGLAPALSVCRADAGDVLKSGGRGTAAGSSGRFRSALVVAQVALSLTLLVSGVLFLRSLDGARRVDLGFDPEGILLARAEPGLQGYNATQRLAFYRAARDRIAALPDVEHVAWISFPPLGIVGDIAEVIPADRPRDTDSRPPIAYEMDISAEYFATARVRLVAGRAFDDRDTADAPPVVIVNETLARQFWPGTTPLGRRLTADGATFEIVGVVADGKYRNVGEAPQAAVFKSLLQSSPRAATIAVRTRRSPTELASPVRQSMQGVDPEVAVYDVRPMTDHLDNGAYFVFRLGAFIASLFGAMGVLLASIGLYGVIAYYVTSRSREFGVRMAIGATATDIIREVLGHGGRMAIAGVAIGLLLAATAARVMRGLLIEVSPFDPLMYAAVAALLLAICLAASFAPARRATRVDPITALRAD